jgi:DNA-directed RNA polymerase specialized sigma subunit
LTDQTTEVITTFFVQAMNVVSRAVDELDPTRGQRLERLASFAMERALAMAGTRLPSGRAAARHDAGSILLPNRFETDVAITRSLSLREDLLPQVSQLAEVEQRVIIARYGLQGERPATFIETAQRLGMKPVGVVRAAQRAIRELRRIARGG